MNYKRILERYINTLNCEIEQKSDPLKLLFFQIEDCLDELNKED